MSGETRSGSVGENESESEANCSSEARTSLESTSVESESISVTQIELTDPSKNTQSVPTTISTDAKTTVVTEQCTVEEETSTSIKYECVRGESAECDYEPEYGPENSDVYDDGDEEDTVSSEAVVDDIELILMPEETQDLLVTEYSPKLVRVTELTSSTENADVFRDDEEDGADGESDFRKMDNEITEENQNEENEDEENEDAAGLSQSLDEEDPEPSSGRDLIHLKRGKSCKVNSGVQTDITALEDGSSSPYEFRRKTSGKTGRLGIPGKKLNWKSELTLLPSKTKIGQGGFNAYGSTDDRDQYSPRVAKFTSQDTLNSSSQFLKPSTLYRTRNLSRNLNRFASSESTLVLPMTELPSDSPRYRDRVSSSISAVNFKGSASHSSYQISSSSLRRLPSYSSAAKNFRSSLPDLSAHTTSSHDNKRRQSQKSMKHHQSSSGFRLQKKLSSSDDETSSLIDESERCLRSSIDLLLTDDYPSPVSDYPLRSGGLGSYASGYYSSRRSCSQPILTDQGYCAEPRDPSMGSPFLPRKLSDMRCSRWAKVILPNGHVAVVSVKEMDEYRDSLTVHTDTGCILSLPFRKVVFAWRTKR